MRQSKKLAVTSMKRVIAMLLTLALVITAAGITPAQVSAAAKFSFKNSVSALTAGSKYSLKTNGKGVVYSSSKKSVATISRKGKITAKAPGLTTIYAKNANGSKVKTKILVVDKDGTVATKTNLNRVLKSPKVSKITLKTNKAYQFTIGKGDYSKKFLLVNAPNADVSNAGVFQSITIAAIKDSTWTENAKGNKFIVSDAKASIVVGSKATVESIKLTSKNAELNLQNNGSVSQLSITGSNAKAFVQVDAKASIGTISLAAKNANLELEAEGAVKNLIVNKKAEILVSGSAEKIPVVINAKAAGTELNSSVTIEATLNANAVVKLQQGAEGSSIETSKKEVVAEITNDTKENVIVKNENGQEAVVEKDSTISTDKVVPTPSPTPTATPAPTSAPSGGDSGGGNNSGGGNTPTSAPVPKYTVTFATSGSAVSPKACSQGSTLGDLPNTVKSESDFIGWYTVATVSGESAVTSSTVVNGNMTLYAQWEAGLMDTPKPMGLATYSAITWQGLPHPASVGITSGSDASNIEYKKVGKKIIVTGILKKVSGFVGFWGGNVPMQNGYYIAISMPMIKGAVSDGASIITEGASGTRKVHNKTNLDGAGYFDIIMRVASPDDTKANNFKVIISGADASLDRTYEFNLSGVKLDKAVPLPPIVAVTQQVLSAGILLSEEEAISTEEPEVTEADELEPGDTGAGSEEPVADLPEITSDQVVEEQIS